MNIEESNDQFEFWLLDMEEAIERFRRTLPLADRGKLDYSAESLAVVEAVALSAYHSVQEATAPSEAKRIDQFARYVGQVFRKKPWRQMDHRLLRPKERFFRIASVRQLEGTANPALPPYDGDGISRPANRKIFTYGL